MSRGRWVAAAIGFASGVGILLALQPMTTAFQMQSAFFADFRPPLIWAVVLGFAVGGLATAGIRFDPLVSAVPAAILFLAYLPIFAGRLVDFYPSWIRWRVLGGFGLLPYAIVGVLAAASAWPLLERQWLQPKDDHPD